MTPGSKGSTIPGVLVSVNGSGLLLQGESGIGKSELALQLIERGHQLVADDGVVLVPGERGLTGRAPEALRGYLELRGLGPCPVEHLYGPGALREEARITLVIALTRTADWAAWPRLAPVMDAVALAQAVTVPRLRLPVAPERPLPLLVEAVARLHDSGLLHGETDHA